MQKTREYRLFCPSGMEVVLLDAGASLAQVHVADREGAPANVVLPPRSLDDPTFAGAVLAPYAGRIPGGLLRVGEETVQLACNEGSNQLHGGVHTLSHRLWTCEGLGEGSGWQEIAFSAEAADGEDGFPGNRRFTAVYRLYENRRLVLTLTAETDRLTRVNLSHHPYFNLSGDLSRSIGDHLLCIPARAVYLCDTAFLTSGCDETLSAALDFTRERYIGDAREDTQLALARGLNHCYVLATGAGQPAATLVHSASGRRLRIYTDAPCLTAYAGGFLSPPNSALALEAQDHPESSFAPETAPLRPGEVLQRTMVYQFDTVPE
mgnify:FL=1